MRLTTLFSYARIIAPALAACQISMAGGLYLIEVSTTETSLAGAGWAARAQDPTTVATNPAGMTELEGRQFQSMLQPLYLGTEFEDDGGSSFGNGGSSDADGWTPTGSAFYTHRINDKWAAGIGLVGYFGLSLDYDDDWAGRYYVQEVTLQTVGVQPTIAYKINEQWSVGAGISILYGQYELIAATNTPGPTEDGELKFEDDEFSIQANIGILYKLNDRTRFGLQYFSESDQDFKDTPSFKNISPPINDVTINMTLPQSVIVSGFHQATDRFAIMGNIGWQEWSRFGEIGVRTTAGGTSTFDRQYEDTWNVAAGMQYQLNEKWRLNTGLAYDTEMVKEENMTPDLPTGDSIRWGIGTNYQYSEAIELQFAYELVYYGDLDLDAGEEPTGGSFEQGRVSGTYPDNAIHFFSVGLNWKF